MSHIDIGDPIALAYWANKQYIRHISYPCLYTMPRDLPIYEPDEQSICIECEVWPKKWFSWQDAPTIRHQYYLELYDRVRINYINRIHEFWHKADIWEDYYGRG